MTKFSPKEYDAWYETPLGRLCDRLEKEAVFSLFQPKGLVLDIGCGTGNYTLELARHGRKVVGIDSSLKMIVFAKRKAEGENLPVNFVVGSGEAIPFKGNAFHGAIAVTALCFIANPETMIAETERILKTDGTILVGELNKFSYWAFLRRLKGWLKKSAYRKARFYSIKTLQGMLQNMGFKNLYWSSCLHFPPLNSSWFLKQWQFFEIIGKKLFPENGAFIVIAGRK
jgi:ubiquinone/menaquinone biosynthesis C-methylase UbiE